MWRSYSKALEGLPEARDDLVKALGCEGSPRARCRDLRGNRVVDSFLATSDGGAYCYLWLDALSQKVREEGRIST